MPAPDAARDALQRHLAFVAGANMVTECQVPLSGRYFFILEDAQNMVKCNESVVGKCCTQIHPRIFTAIGCFEEMNHILFVMK